MGIKYKVERKISHHEWDEVTLPADDFFKLFELLFTDDDEEGKLCTGYFYPNFQFEKGCTYTDELWGVSNGKVETSSFGSGAVSWSEKRGQYLQLTHGEITELGNLISVSFTLDDDLRRALEAIEEQE